MRNKLRQLLLAASILTIGCSKMSDSEGLRDMRPIRVEIGAKPGIDIESRTALDEDGCTVRWAPGDRIALWALDAEGTAVFEAQPFELRHYDASYDEARFTGSISPMAQGSYTYCAVSPLPAAHEGTRVSYDIPAEQNGSFDGSLDVMVAEPTADAPALAEGYNEHLSLKFHHKIHLLRITIPAGGNNLQEPIAALELEFPQPVVGRLTLDAQTPDAAPELTDGGNKLTIRLDHPVAADEEVCVYAAIAPITLTADDAIRIKAVGTGGGESMASTMQGKAFAAGHTTPIKYYVPDRYRITRIFFSLAGRDARTDLPEDLADGYGCSTLGEPVTAFTLTGPEGVDLGNGTNTRTFEVNKENLYEIYYEGVFTDNLSGQPFTVTFESEHTIGVPYYESVEAKTAETPYSFLMPQLTADIRNTVKAFTVPYLLKEDFSGASNHDYTNSTDELSGIGLPGWGASRYEFQSNRAAIYMYVGTSTSSIDNKRGRLDTPFLPIREGSSISVNVSYNIGAPIVEVSGVWPFTSDSRWCVTCEFGTQNDTDGGISGDDAISNVLEEYTPADGGDFTSLLPQAKTNISVPGATGNTRLTWRAANYQKISGSAPITARYFYIYIDDIQVSIARE